MQFSFNKEKMVTNYLESIMSKDSIDSILHEFKYLNPIELADEVTEKIEYTNSYDPTHLQNLLCYRMDGDDESEMVEYLSTHTEDSVNVPELVDSINSVIDEIKAGYEELKSAIYTKDNKIKAVSMI